MKKMPNPAPLALSLSVEELLRELSFSEEDLVRATRMQASLFLEASKYRVQQMRMKFASVAAFETAMSSQSLRFRRLGRQSKDTKMTETAIRDHASIAQVVVDARRRMDIALVNEEFSKLLLEAFRHRRDACRILGEVMISEGSAEVRIAKSAVQVASLRRLRQDVERRWPGRENGEDEE